jgi:hypothetical protein
MRNTHYILIFVISLNISSQSIVDIENLRHSGEIGYFKSLGLSVNGSRGNEDRDDYKLDFSVARNNEDIESFFTINNSKRTKNNVIEDKSSFFHGRVLLKSESFYSYEFYIQGSKNPFQSYRKRDLAGAGIRINAKNKYKVGLSFLQEKEESLSGIFKKTERVNLYLYKKFILKNDNSLTGSLFYQPSINDFGSDYKISLLTSFNFPITDNLKISFQVSSSLDNEPPDISEKSNHSFSTNFRYSF